MVAHGRASGNPGRLRQCRGTQGGRGPPLAGISRVGGGLSKSTLRNSGEDDRFPRDGPGKPTGEGRKGRGHLEDGESLGYAFGITFPGSMNGFLSTAAPRGSEGCAISLSLPTSENSLGVSA